MLKLALSLVAFLTLATPSYAACVSPDKFPNSEKIVGSDITKFREVSRNLPAEVDLVLLLKNAPIAIAFVKGCAVSVGAIGPVAAPAPKTDGSI